LWEERTFHIGGKNGQIFKVPATRVSAVARYDTRHGRKAYNNLDATYKKSVAMRQNPHLSGYFRQTYA